MLRLSKALAWLALVLSAACSGSGGTSGGGAAGAAPVPQETASGSAGSAAAAAPAPDAGADTNPNFVVPPGAIRLFHESNSPAQLYVLELEALGIQETEAVATPSGAVIAALAKGGLLRYATAADDGTLQTGQVTLVAAGKTYVLPVYVMGRMPFEPSSPDHGNEDGTPAVPTPALTVTGLAPGHAIGSQPIRLRPSDGVVLDPRASSGEATDSRGRVVPLQDYWKFDPADQSFTIAGDALARLRSQLAPGLVQFDLSLQNSDYSVARVYMFGALRGDARLAGRLVTAGGADASHLAGYRVLLRGYHKDVTRVVTVDAAGGFAFDDLIPDTYEVSLLDLHHPGMVGATVEVFADTTTVAVRIVDLVERGGGSRPAAKDAVSGGVRATGEATQDGTPPRSRGGAEPKSATVSPDGECASRMPDGTMVFTAMSRARGQAVSCPVAFTVPQNTERVGVEIQVASQEFPKYTRQASDYNDTWRFSLQGLPDAQLVDSGSVNQSHEIEGTTRQLACVDVAKLTAAGPLAVNGVATATSVGDSTLATAVFVKIGLQCSRALVVRTAAMRSPGPSGQPMVSPKIVGGNLAGRYLSISPDRLSPAYKIPLHIAYSPADARIDKVELGLQEGDAAPVFAADNLLAQPAKLGPGLIAFDALALPPWPVGRSGGTVRLVARLTGSVAGKPETSDLWKGSRVVFDRADAFIPLYSAHDEPALTQRRYGTRDPGGDSWATAQAIGWLGGNAYRFDDISAQHVLQTLAGRSVLAHQGHSDGQQIDLRYADGQGGFEDAMGGQSDGMAIRAALARARAEVRTDAAAKPGLARIVAWIHANRQMIGAQASAAGVRQVYIGKDWMEQALVGGRFSDGTAIPGVGAWAKPANVKPEDKHLSHWHVSLDARPSLQAAAGR